MILYLALITVLLISLITDLQQRKILNVVTIPSMVFGLLFHTIMHGFDGFLYSGAGLLVGFGLLLLPYLLGGMGAGDVKLMAAIGALMGTTFVLYSFLFTAIIGGLISLFLIVYYKGFKNSIKSLYYGLPFLKGNLGSLVLEKSKKDRITFPYGVAIILGTLCAFVWGGF